MLGDFTLGKAQMDDLIETQENLPLEYSNINEVLENEMESESRADMLKKHGYEDFEIIEKVRGRRT